MAASKILTGSALPSTCTTGAIFIKTGSAAGLYICDPATPNTWLGPYPTSAGTGTVTTTGSPSSGNLTKFSGSTSITNADLTGDVSTSGGVSTTLANSGVSAGSYTNADITVDAKGRVTAAASGVVDLATEVTGNLAVTHLDSGTGASSTTFWRGDGSWSAASGTGGGTVTNTGTLTAGKTIIGNAGSDVTISSLTATVVKSSSGTLSAATAGTDYVVPGCLTAATVSTDEICNSSSYTNLATSGPSVTLTLVGTTAVIWLAATGYKTGNVNNIFMSVDVSGASTVAASDTNATVVYTQTINTVHVLSRVLILTGLTPGSTTFKAQYKADTNNNSHFYNRSIAVYAP